PERHERQGARGLEPGARRREGSENERDEEEAADRDAPGPPGTVERQGEARRGHQDRGVPGGGASNRPEARAEVLGAHEIAVERERRCLAAEHPRPRPERPPQRLAGRHRAAEEREGHQGWHEGGADERAEQTPRAAERGPSRPEAEPEPDEAGEARRDEGL